MLQTFFLNGKVVLLSHSFSQFFLLFFFFTHLFCRSYKCKLFSVAQDWTIGVTYMYIVILNAKCQKKLETSQNLYLQGVGVDAASSFFFLGEGLLLLPFLPPFLFPAAAFWAAAAFSRSLSSSLFLSASSSASLAASSFCSWNVRWSIFRILTC